MRTALYVLLALAAPALAGQTVWKWVDDKGVTHYSDQPVPGATKMELNSSNRSGDATPSFTPPAQNKAISERAGPAYSRFAIDSPQQDETIINTGGRVRVSVAATPAIRNGQLVTIYLDGARVEFPPTATSYDLADVPRGTHTLKAVVSNPDGRPLQETPPVTFHVRQESVAQPPVGPALKNPPKPRSSAGNKMRTTQPTYSALNGGTAPIDPRTNRPAVSKPAPSGPKN